MQHMKKQLGSGLHVAAFITTEGYTYCYNNKEDRRKFGEFFVHNVLTKKDYLKILLTNLRKKTDEYARFLQRVRGKEAAQDIFEQYKKLFHEFIPLYTTQRAIVDYIPADKVHLVFEPLEESRKYTENTLKATQDFLEAFAEQISGDLGRKLEKHHVLCMTIWEVGHYFKNGALPKKKVLEERHKKCALIFSKNRFDIKAGKDAQAIEDALIGSVTVSEVKGICAYKGVVRGVVRIVFDPATIKDFRKGEIIVTGMTRPEFIHLMKKAAAFVTDLGGILSHAAIVAREMKKPCVIGTDIATKVFKDGDIVEVDAEKGIVRKIEKHPKR